MKIVIDGTAGELAARPVDAIEALRRAAVQDGADPDEWMAKAMASQGAASMGVPVSVEPRHPVVAEFTDEVLRLYAIATDSMKRAIGEVLEAEARDAVHLPEGPP